MGENCTVRNNLMKEKDYAPYCGNSRCKYHWPRVTWDNCKGQFTCGCGWVSEFPDSYIDRYRKKWNKVPLLKLNDDRIIYIDYRNDIPFSITTENMDHFDVEVDCKDENGLMFYHSGSGGNIEYWKLGQTLEKDCCSFWLHPNFKVKDEGNIKRLTIPLLINDSYDPLKDSREVTEMIYCKECGKILDEDRCEHLTTDADGNTIYTTGEPHE